MTARNLISVQQFSNFIAPLRPVLGIENLYDSFVRAADKYGINTKMRIRHFLAQAGYECAYFTKLSESLYYTDAKRLVAVWPSRFSMTKGDGKLYAPDFLKDSSKVANTAYANRFGNGDAASGDGMKYRGRGAFHLTFHDNYADASLRIYGDDRLVRNPDLVATDCDAVMLTAGDYWNVRNLNPLADGDEFTKITSIVNGAKGATLTRVVSERSPVLSKIKKAMAA